jgi:8-oxo-dGTP pyrophosphatase MutT (NUDIX family)
MRLTPLPHPEHPDPYSVQERRWLYDSPWIRVREDHFRHRQGAQGRYAVCGFLRTACGVLALDDQDRVALVGQWRYPLEAYSWEIPEGGGEATESPFEAIQRELAEEAGLAARTWEPLCFFHPSNSSSEEEAFLFLATGLAANSAHQPENDEELQLRWEPFSQCLQRVLAGEITDSLTVVALLALQARRSGVPALLEASLAERFFQRPQDHPSPGRARWATLERP